MSLTLAELKQYMYDNELLESLLHELGCTDYKYTESHTNRDDLITARLPGSTNARGVQIYWTPYLNTQLVGEGISGDIYALVGFINHDARTFEQVRENLYYIKTYVCNVLNISEVGYIKPEKKQDWNYWLPSRQRSTPKKEFDIPINPPIPLSTMDTYIQGAWHGWIEEGISIDTQKEFGIGFDLFSDRITIPVHNKKNELIGVKGRYVGPDTVQINRFKYKYLISCSKAIELFNLNRALPYIEKEKTVIVVEGAKTTMLLWEWGYKNAVSLEGDRLSSIQALLLKDLGLDIDIVFAWDKDKQEDFVHRQISQIKNRDISYLYDNQNLFEDHDSPCDRGKDTFAKLYTECRIRTPEAHSLLS